jgi:rhodanese-related sulfurtransferase
MADADKGPTTGVTGATLLAAIEAGAAPTILDVRSRREFLHGHVPGAVHIPYWAVPRRHREIPSAAGDPLVVYCGHGPRAWMAGAALRLRGFRHIAYLTGHMAAWRRARLREESGQTTPR